MSDGVTDLLPTREESAETHRRYSEELAATWRAIAVGIAESGIRLSKKQEGKIRKVVDAALDALPWGHGAQDLTLMELEFAQTFAKDLAQMTRKDSE